MSYFYIPARFVDRVATMDDALALFDFPVDEGRARVAFARSLPGACAVLPLDTINEAVAFLQPVDDGVNCYRGFVPARGETTDEACDRYEWDVPLGEPIFTFTWTGAEGALGGSA